MDKKKRVLFIGSFIKVNSDGGTGGQLFACTSLLESDLFKQFEFVLVDSSTKLPIPNILGRIFKAYKRLLISFYHLCFSRIDSVLVFSADGLSIIEKGVICILAKKIGKKVIIAPRSGFLLNDLKNRKLKWFIGLVFLNSDFVICQGNAWKLIFMRNFPLLDSSKFVEVMNWIDLKKYKSIIDKDQESNEITFLFLGWIEREKGVEDLIKAVGLVEENGFKVILAGNGSYFDDANKLIRELNIEKKVELIGWVDFNTKLALLKLADVFILPSHFEGMPNAIMEAMASGLPIISTLVGGIPDMVIHDENGKLGDVKNPIFLSNSISYFINNTSEIHRMALNSEMLVVRNHNITQASKKISSLL